MRILNRPDSLQQRRDGRGGSMNFAWLRVVLTIISTLIVAPDVGRTEVPTGDSPPPLRLTLNEALALFLTQNLDVLMAQYSIETAKGQEITARLFPNPVLGLGTISSVTMGNSLVRSGEIWANVQQLFLVAGKRGYRIEGARLGRQSAEAAFEDAIRQLKFAVKDNYVHVRTAQRHLEIAQENRDRFTRILDINSVRFEKGFISGVDLVRIRLQAVDFENTVIQSEQDLESALSDLRVVLALPPETTFDLVTALEYQRMNPELPALQQLAADRPDILAKRLTLSQRTAELKLAKALRYPDPSIGPGFTLQGARGPDNPQQYTLGLSIPLPVFDRNQGGIAQSEAAIGTAEADLRKTILQAKNDVNVAFKTLMQSRRLVEAYQAGVLDDARSSLSIMEAAYQRGGATILDLLDASRTAAAVQLNYVDALGSYQRTLFQLESAVGKELTVVVY
jgi:cobalt-zinc-cadmium efflux system outer membrane protein